MSAISALSRARSCVLARALNCACAHGPKTRQYQRWRRAFWWAALPPPQRRRFEILHSADAIAEVAGPGRCRLQHRRHQYRPNQHRRLRAFAAGLSCGKRPAFWQMERGGAEHLLVGGTMTSEEAQKEHMIRRGCCHRSDMICCG
jgi:hypothetical protein